MTPATRALAKNEYAAYVERLQGELLRVCLRSMDPQLLRLLFGDESPAGIDGLVPLGVPAQMRNVTPIAEDEYRCCQCKGVFKKGWSEEEAKAEAAENFGAFDSSMAVVCDDCYNMIMGKEGSNATS